MSIKVCYAALDDAPSNVEGQAGNIILRGVVDPRGFNQLKVDSYQREVLPISSLRGMIDTFMTGGSVPDIELGMRGQRIIERDGCFHLQDDVYIVDGLQRISAGQIAIQHGAVPRIGAAIYFDTNPGWERKRFEVLNAHRTKLSSNVLLRNLREDLEVMDMLVRLSDDPSFVLKGRVCWDQRMTRSELISAITMATTIGRLHSHLGPTRSNRYSDLASGLEKTMAEIGKGVMRDNIRTFFEIVDSCWGIKRIAYKEGAVYMRQSFLIALAEVLSGHLDFWRDSRLFLEASLLRKLSQFPVSDPHVQNLASSSGKARQMLELLMVEHINSYKRSKRLTARSYFGDMDGDDGTEELVA